ncbi:MAG: hypothetical protein AMS22_06875 [Thiotrichales bacterium SG8_50]|nr:MAG: hypothetical protein AMS22_06875 [Thiotrichales bacterium SG8_50]
MKHAKCAAIWFGVVTSASAFGSGVTVGLGQEPPSIDAPSMSQSMPPYRFTAIDSMAGSIGQLGAREIHARLTSVEHGASLVTRGAKETKIYSDNVQAVVLVVKKDGFGSGVVISKDGTILTNWHVIEGASDVGVIFKPSSASGQPSKKDLRRAKVVRIDEVSDLALIRLTEKPPKNVKTIAFGSMSEIQVGSDVHAIGHPTGQTWTYTKGLVSQIRPGFEWATDSTRKHTADVIQTQTPINPGNSGGPLLSDSGTLVGINSFKSEGEALNFAVSISDVRRFMSTAKNRYASPTRPAMAAAASSECKAREIKQGTDKNGAMVSWWDTDCDGKIDTWFIQPKDPSKPFTAVFDSNGDGKGDILVMDTNRDGKWDISYYDIDFDGKIDLVGYHPDGEIVASRVEIYRG